MGESRLDLVGRLRTKMTEPKEMGEWQPSPWAGKFRVGGGVCQPEDSLNR